jgi:carbonic anhydrase
MKAKALLLALALTLVAAARAADTGPSVTPDDALTRLKEGNARYVAEKPIHPNQDSARRAAITNSQAPFAIVLTCSDSRVAPELLFDQGLGDLFVIRNAGNVLDDQVLASMEYAVEHLHVGLIVVLGHEKCGAVSATVAGGKVPGHIHNLVEAIEPALEKAANLPGDKVDNTVRIHAQRSTDILVHVEPILSEAVQEHKLTIVAARYELGSGRVEILKPAETAIAKQ